MMAQQYITWVKIRFNEHDNEEAFIRAVRKKMQELIDEVGFNNAGATMIPVIEIHWGNDLMDYDETTKDGLLKPDVEKIEGLGWKT